MYLIIFYRENNKNHLVYHLNTGIYSNYEVGEYNGYSWLVLAKLVLYHGIFVNENTYRSLLQRDVDMWHENDRRRAIKEKKRNRLISLLEGIRNGI